MSVGIEDIITQANVYLTLAKTKANSHYKMSETASRKNLALGIFVTLFSSVVGTTIFAAISQGSVEPWIQFITGFMSIIAAVLAAFQTFFHFNEISQQNKNAATSYNKIRNLLDLFLLTYLPTSEQRENALTELKSIVGELQKVEDSSPSVPDSVFDKLAGKIKK
jgi:hypothetical protein